MGKQTEVRICDVAWLPASSAKGERRPVYHFLISVGFPKIWQSAYFHIYISWFSHTEEELVLKCQSAGLEQVGAAPFLLRSVEAGLERRRGHWAGSLPVGSSLGLRGSVHALRCKQSSEHPPSQPAGSALILESASGVGLLRTKVSTVFRGGECIVQTLYNVASAWWARSTWHIFILCQKSTASPPFMPARGTEWQPKRSLRNSKSVTFNSCCAACDPRKTPSVFHSASVSTSVGAEARSHSW